MFRFIFLAHPKASLTINQRDILSGSIYVRAVRQKGKPKGGLGERGVVETCPRKPNHAIGSWRAANAGQCKPLQVAKRSPKEHTHFALSLFPDVSC